MMPNICLLVFAHICHIGQNFGTPTWSHNNFMVIVEPWSVIKNKPRDFWKSKLALNGGFELNKILLSGTILEGKQTTHISRWPVYFIKSWKLIWSVFMVLTWKRFLKKRGWQFTYILLQKVLNYTFSWIRQKSLGLHRTP